ncbi:MAG: ATP-dependent helicase [Cytophagales bacterium]|nr:ATP-dependent helicase [Cytophagales bacterium]
MTQTPASAPQKSKKHYDLIFEKELEMLNPAQKEAVSHIDGPVLVIAGPGTGKTHLLAARIGKILKSTDAQPHNILCLTYTDAGTIAMRQRLLEFIGPVAYRVSIYTFHAFCNDIIQRNPDYFGNRELEPISELENIELLMQLLDELDSESSLKRRKGNIYYEVPLLNNLFRKMKEEPWFTEHISECIDTYLNDLPGREEYIYKVSNKKQGYQKGDLKQHLIDKEIEKMGKLQEAANLLPKYRQKMKESNRYDYSDMILWVLDAFKKDKNFLRTYQENFLYFLVDEFQDTNGAQNEILTRLIDYWDKPNVFAVGDDDQSIYEFQGARMKNILDFYKRYEKDIKVVVLTDNYRSSQHLLDSAKALIDNNEERLINKISDLSKNLTAKKEAVARSVIKPRIIRYHNIKHEEAAIVQQIEALHKQEFPLNEVAVIYYRHRQAEDIINLMEKKGIPYNVIRKINILDLPLVQNLLNLLEYILAEYESPHSGEHLLFESMHYNFFNISPMDIAKISAYCGKNWETKWRDVITDEGKLTELKLEKPGTIAGFEKNINHWISEVANLTLQMLFEKIINFGGVLKYIMNSPEKTWLMQVLTTFFDFIKEEGIKNPRLSIKALLETVDKMRANGIAMEVNKTVYEENGVNFITAYRAKGMEFEYVFLIGCTKDIWESKGRGSSFSLPDTPTHTKDENLLESARRVFYVAMTRAKERLHISFSKQNNNGKELERAVFVAEILEKIDLPVEEQHRTNEQLTEFSFEALQEVETPPVELLDKDFIKALLEKYSMSITHLNKYLRCHVAFYYENILRVPAAKNDAMAFGSAVHFALKRLFDKMQQSDKNQFPSKEEYLKDFLWEMKRNKNSFTDQQFKRRKELCEQMLPAYFDKYIHTWNKIVKTEFNIRNVEMDGIPINGKLDKLEFDRFDVNVVDYKTGSVEYGLKKLNPPDDKDLLGGDYWRQVVFYKILMDNFRPKKWMMVSGEIDFIEKDQKKTKDFVKVKVNVSREDINFVKNQVKETWQKIMNHEFTEGCEEEDCYWCNFVKNQFVSEEHLPVNEEEDACLQFVKD